MSFFVTRIGGRKIAVAIVLCWVGLAVAAVLAGGRLGDVRVTSGDAMLARGAESARVLSLMAQQQGGRVIPTTVVYERAGPLLRQDVVAVRHDIRRFAVVPGVLRAARHPVPSGDGQALQVPLLLSGQQGVLVEPVVQRLRQITGEGLPAGLSGHVTGLGGAGADYADAFQRVDVTLLALSLGVVFLVLVAVYRSPVLWLVPMIAVVVAYLCAGAAVCLLSREGLLDVLGATPEVFTVLVFGVATDYALLLVARYRERLRVTHDRDAALREALAGGVRTVVASALTVAGGLGCLLVADTNALRSIGAAAAVGVVVTMVVMVTFLPALMALGGRWAFWPVIPRPGGRERDRLWRRVAGFVGRRSPLAWAGSALLLAVACLGLATVNAAGIPPSGLFTQRTDSVEGHDALARHYTVNAPVVVLARDEASEAVARTVRGVQGVVAVRPGPPAPWRAMEVTLAAEPSTAEASRLVGELRRALAAGPVAGQALVGGLAAEFVDSRDAAVSDARAIVPLILLVVALVLVVLLRSVAAPLLLIGTVVLSFAATLGLCSALFTRVLGFPAMDPSFVLYAFVFLVAFGIDYNIFLMARVREEAVALDTREATLRALRVTGGVITAAGVVLAAAFAVLAVLPLVPVVQLGLLVAVGVVLDTVLVRSFLVPALAHHLGPRVWWPARRSRHARTRLAPQTSAA
ncbi:MMPL family transporter [Actinomadura sp. ATCC 31491]|uniref:MMPL family transporter n=1 Tax=Actinomadura luzonensis TaxID=2805427 RepID=A0ABT0GBK2_9ACTN|nr:MMPL family transporter [Actinomadura luzonensis]MCK2221972.1 MMPL family transporter [Actinomadura luzonensis]